MKLSELVEYKISLEQLLPDVTTQQTNDSLSAIVETTGNKRLLEIQNTILENLGHFIDEFEQHKDAINKKIEDRERKYLEYSYEIYSNGADDSDEYILSQKNPITVDNTSEYAKRIEIHATWKVPGVYIRPKQNEIIKNMTACDPLYVIDHTYGLLEPVRQLWTKEYQTRLRFITIDDNDEKIFSKLPQSQIGLVVATEFFNFKPFEVIKKYLEELYKVLRPGGIVMFTYNNCDLPGPVRNVENGFNCYTPGHLLQSLAESLGYEVIYSNDSPNGLNWLELKKAGEIKTLRGGQALAAIKDSRLDN